MKTRGDRKERREGKKVVATWQLLGEGKREEKEKKKIKMRCEIGINQIQILKSTICF